MLRYGIIGCGMMGQEHLRNISLLDNATVAAIFEPDPDMRAAAAALVPGARLVGAVAEVLAVPEVNCLLIASPNHLHLGQLEEIARIRPLPVLCEKPLFTEPADATPRRSGWRWNTATCHLSRICCARPKRQPAG
jgi:predicted dehydrogenase